MAYLEVSWTNRINGVPLYNEWSRFGYRIHRFLIYYRWRRVYSIEEYEIGLIQFDKSQSDKDPNLIQVFVSVPVNFDDRGIIWKRTFINGVKTAPVKLRWWQRRDRDNDDVRSLDEVILEARKWAEKRVGISADIEEKVEEVIQELCLREKAYKQVREKLLTSEEKQSLEPMNNMSDKKENHHAKNLMVSSELHEY